MVKMAISRQKDYKVSRLEAALQHLDDFIPPQ
jgi:hypothetical protein